MKYIPSEPLNLLEALERLSPGTTKNTLRKWIKEERVQVDHRLATKANQIVKAGVEIEVGSRPVFLDGGIKILFEDEHFIVIHKPEGLLSVAAQFENKKTAHSLLKRRYLPQRVMVVHRLDQDTSGVMLFALTEEARDRLKAIFEKHELERRYVAIVEGLPNPLKGEWRSYLFEDAAYRVHSTDDPKKGELAITHYEAVKKNNYFSWIEVMLETGKKNQIRVHAKDAGTPVAGDKKYGSTKNPIRRLALHARLLSFIHPFTGKKMRFESPPPESFFSVFGLKGKNI